MTFVAAVNLSGLLELSALGLKKVQEIIMLDCNANWFMRGVKVLNFIPVITVFLRQVVKWRRGGDLAPIVSLSLRYHQEKRRAFVCHALTRGGKQRPASLPLPPHSALRWTLDSFVIHHSAVAVQVATAAPSPMLLLNEV